MRRYMTSEEAKLKDQLSTALADVARLKVALQAIINETEGENRMRFVAQGPRAVIHLVNIARGALAEPDES